MSKEPFVLTPIPDLIPGLRTWGTTAGRYQFIIGQDDAHGWSASYRDMQHDDAKTQRIRNKTSGDFFDSMAEAMEAIRTTYKTLPKSQRHELTRLFGEAQPEYNAAHKMVCASSFDTSICSLCDALHLVLYDPHGKPFGEATISIAQVDDMVQRLQLFKQTIIMRSKTEGLRN